MKGSRLGVMLLMLAAGAAGVALAGPATVVHDSTLHAQPALDAPALARLAAAQRVEIIGAHGAWNQVSTADGKTGWVRLLNLRPEAARTGSGLAGLARLGNVARTGSTGAAATTGVKGISKEDLAAAQPNFAEVERLEQYRAQPAAARQYAAAMQLRARDVALLPEPKQEGAR